MLKNLYSLSPRMSVIFFHDLIKPGNLFKKGSESTIRLIMKAAFRLSMIFSTSLIDKYEVILKNFNFCMITFG